METPQSGRKFLNKNYPSKRLYLKMAKELSTGIDPDSPQDDNCEREITNPLV
jgi:hypothetical protein